MEALRQDLLAFVLSTVGLSALVGVGEALRIWGRVSAEGSRRVVHAGVGVFVASTPYWFDRPGLVYVLAVVFVVVNYATLRRGWLRGIHATARQSLGTVTFPLALLPTLVISAMLLSLGAMAWFKSEGQIDWKVGEIAAAAFLVAAATTAVEALGRRGWDNFFIVQAALVVLVFFDEQPAVRLVLLLAAVAGLVFGLIAYRLRFLDGPGSIAGGLLAASVIGLGGWAWAVPSFTFFVVSNLLSHVGRRRKAAVEAVSEKGSRRDAGQVFANGGVGWALLLVYAVFPAEVLYWGFLGAFAAATADTWGTEIGTLSSKLPRLITTGRQVPRGTSGAVSAVGTLGALAGALAIGLSAWPFVGGSITSLAMAGLAVVGGGFVGSLVDSLAGATVQARFRDPRTGAETERSASDEGTHRLIRGRRWLRNDQVNGFCTFSGATFAMACFQATNFASYFVS